MKTIADAKKRLETAVRMTSEVYALKAYQGMDMAAYAPIGLDINRKRMMFRYAWHEVCEWVSLGFDLSDREDLLSIWRQVSAERHIATNIQKVRINAENSGVRSEEMRLLPSGINYYPSARDDLQGLTDTALKDIAMDDGEFVWKPEGLADFYKEEVVEIARLIEEEDKFFRSTTLGRIFVNGTEDTSDE